jgi:hypothetical protein
VSAGLSGVGALTVTQVVHRVVDVALSGSGTLTARGLTDRRDITIEWGSLVSRTLTGESLLSRILGGQLSSDVHGSETDDMNMSRIDRVYGYVSVTVTDIDGNPTTVAGVDVALLPPQLEPDGDTVWHPTAPVNGKGQVLFVGVDADPTDGLVVPEGDADVWGRVIDNPEVLTAKVGRISVG